jgi:hypothetical protein
MGESAGIFCREQGGNPEFLLYLVKITGHGACLWQNPMKSWKFEYEGNTIEVQNYVASEKLLINNHLQDERQGLAFRSRLWGELVGADGRKKSVKVSLGGWLRIHCLVFIDNREAYRS